MQAYLLHTLGVALSVREKACKDLEGVSASLRGFERLGAALSGNVGALTESTFNHSRRFNRCESAANPDLSEAAPQNKLLNFRAPVSTTSPSTQP